ncbi:P-loop containing nucleoside triphosphate hydrolase protein [Aspergillus japonicus CBS 114.51]|uniref:P-loop containing nucleoside triphosphate hydrolase protein n=1 Tax=Aspergillus japonicus CBS 114.51 TaxID=1448312 RepID=A0A8T8XGA3_ASPJA|nr:P-loop containing nucleoside triphosphate hydrolase protein [Aspergillus japonicus CBS 114.51]RAH87327.1 P-loop containing nucleoside triphosphate hydrolase protein [Aspergillus japonicus CBS 114.51]
MPDLSMQNDEPPDTNFVLLLPHEIHGFGIHDKKWRTLLVEYIKNINWNDAAFDRLVMQHSKKELIKALVTVHTTSSKSTDIIEGKSNALIMLLHGGPGTGKTLTAESVAELTRKPLYRVTCGDIGTNADEVEKYLESVLLIGTIWGCVVLLDEADVFLEERRETDLQRNALVSVFLRVLEYYDGILILTSNRIGTFDGAFKSRFQLAVHYPALNEQGRFEIWLNFINGLSKTNPEIPIDDLKSRLPELAARALNGRQIRNTVRTALQLAHFRQTTLTYEHFQQVIDVAEEFERHIESTRGYSDLDWTRDRAIRSD